jgi:hypothetical protein
LFGVSKSAADRIVDHLDPCSRSSSASGSARTPFGGGFGEFVDQRAAFGLGQERELEGLSDRREPSIGGHRIRPFLLAGCGDIQRRCRPYRLRGGIVRGRFVLRRRFFWRDRSLSRA